MFTPLPILYGLAGILRYTHFQVSRWLGFLLGVVSPWLPDA